MLKNLNNLLLVFALLLGIITIILTQFAIPTLYGTDGYLHIRMADLIKESGPIYDFHWARFSVFSQFFADKSFFYHLMLIPFTFCPNIFFGAKLSACFFAVLFLSAFFTLLSKYVLRPLIPLFVVALFLSGHFLCALSLPRPLTLAMALSLLALYFLIEKRLWGIAIVTVVYCLSHVSGPYILFYALLTESVRFFSKKEFYLKSIIAVWLSIFFAYLIHPNFPNNFLAFYINGVLVPIHAIKGGLQHGVGLLPLSTREFLLNYPLVMIGLLFLAFLGIFSRPRTKFATRVIFVHAALFLILSFLAHRYLVHSYPLIILLLASYTSDYFQHQTGFNNYRKNKLLVAGSIFMLFSLILLFGPIVQKTVRTSGALFEERNSHYERIGSWMRENIPAGELIFHTGWSDSPYFFGINPKNDYLVVLHPIYMYWGNLKVYNLYRNVSAGRTRDLYFFLKHAFKAKYGYAGKKNYNKFISQIRKDPRFKILTEDGRGLVFKLD